MKRIYMTLVFIGAMFGAKAQGVDVQALSFAYDGANFKSGAYTCLDTMPPYRMGNADSVYGALALYVNEGSLLAGDKFSVLSSYNAYVQPGDPNYVDTIKYFYITTYTMNADVDADNFLLTEINQAVDSIQLLYDWNQWNNNDSVVLHGKPWSTFVNGQEYGFFMQFRGIEGVEDSDPTNNRGVRRIIWNGSGVGINEMLAPKEKISLLVYPNPSTNYIKFAQNFEKKAEVTAIVRDAVGRAVMTKNYGKLSGNQEFQLDISRLNPGMYTVELSSEYITGLSKFSKL
jgi:hypothetical protein